MPDTTMLGAADLTAMLTADRRLPDAGGGAAAGDAGGFRRVLDESVAAANDGPFAAGEATGPITERSLAPPARADDSESGAVETWSVDVPGGAVETWSADVPGDGVETRSGELPGGAAETWSGDAPCDRADRGTSDSLPRVGADVSRAGTLPSPAPEAGSEGGEEGLVATGLHPGGADRLLAEHLRDAAEKASAADEPGPSAGQPGSDTSAPGAARGATDEARETSSIAPDPAAGSHTFNANTARAARSRPSSDKFSG